MILDDSHRGPKGAYRPSDGGIRPTMTWSRLPLRRGRLVALAVATVLAAPLAIPVAASAAPAAVNAHFALGRGAKPDIAVGADGTAYVAWVHEGSPGVTNQIQFCRVPRGKRACVGLQTFTLPGQQIGERPYVFLPGGNTVLILSYRCCVAIGSPYEEKSLLLRSSDAGKTFGSPLLVGTHSAWGDAVLGPDGSFYTIDDVVTAGVSVQRGNLNGSAVPAPTDRATLGGDEYGGSLAVLPGGAVLAAHYDWKGSGPKTFHVSEYSGTGDPNVAASWPTVFTGQGGSSPKTGGQDTALASGVKGTYLFTADNEVFARFEVRHWTGKTFSAPTFITPAGQDNIFPSFWEDAAGRVSLAYSSGARVVTYRSSDLKGFATAVTLKASEAFNLRGATAHDGGGFVAYDSNSDTGTVSLVPIPARRVITESVKGSTLSGKVAAFRTGQKVLLEKKTGKGWVAVRSAKLNAKGRYALALPASKVTLTWRAVAPTVEGYAEADGKPFTHS